MAARVARAGFERLAACGAHADANRRRGTRLDARIDVHSHASREIARLLVEDRALFELVQRDFTVADRRSDRIGNTELRIRLRVRAYFETRTGEVVRNARSVDLD